MELKEEMRVLVGCPLAGPFGDGTYALGAWRPCGGEGAGNVPAIVAVQWRLDSLRNALLVRPTKPVSFQALSCQAFSCFGFFYEKLHCVPGSNCHNHSAIMW